MARLQNRVALVTGGASGIGAAICKAFAREGASVLVVDRDEARAQAMAEEVKGIALVCNLGNPFHLNELCEQVSEQYGSLNILVNSAGVCRTKPMAELEWQEWQETFAVNVFGAARLMQDCARLMPQGSSVVNIASVSAFLPKRDQADYGASKAALVSITRSAALVYAEQGIRVNAIAPGVVDTEMTRGIAQHRSEIMGVPAEELLERAAALAPMNRMASPDEVADAAVFLASEESRFITGQVLPVCGGQLMR